MQREPTTDTNTTRPAVIAIVHGPDVGQLREVAAREGWDIIVHPWPRGPVSGADWRATREAWDLAEDD